MSFLLSAGSEKLPGWTPGSDKCHVVESWQQHPTARESAGASDGRPTSNLTPKRSGSQGAPRTALPPSGFLVESDRGNAVRACGGLEVGPRLRPGHLRRDHLRKA